MAATYPSRSLDQRSVVRQATLDSSRGSSRLPERTVVDDPVAVELASVEPSRANGGRWACGCGGARWAAVSYTIKLTERGLIRKGTYSAEQE